MRREREPVRQRISQLRFAGCYPHRMQPLVSNIVVAMLMLLTIACGVGDPEPEDDQSIVDEDDDSAGQDSLATDSGSLEADPEVTEESIGDQVLDDGWIFSQDQIHTLAITLPDTSWAALVASPRDHAPADVVYDGVALENVGLRLRGKLGSFRTIDRKPKMEVDFNRFVSDQRFYGLESMSLNSSIVDCSYVKEPIGYALYAAMGVRTSRAAYVRVSVNEMDYGLYVLVETQDDRLLRRHWGDASGNLYDGKYVWWPNGSYTLLDFGEGNDGLYELEEGEDVGNVDVQGISQAYVDGVAAGDFRSRTDGLVDWENLHRVWAVSQFIGSNDGYSLNKNNYRIHFRASDGRMVMIPWDLDHTFYEDHWWSRSWSNPSGNLARACWSDATCVEEQRQTVSALLDILADVDLPSLNERLQSMTMAQAESDPRRECALDRVVSERAHVTSWLTTRADYLRSFWGL